jgi:hypothetical protein
VGDWLETLGVRSEERRLVLTLRILNEARKRKGKGEPIEAAMDTAFEALEEWAGSIFPEGSRQRSVVQVLVALEGAFPADRAGELILAEPLPKEVVEALRQFSHGGGPEIRRSRMTARGIRYGPMEAIAQETWHRFTWAPIFRALLIWSVVFFLLLSLLGGGRKG